MYLEVGEMLLHEAVDLADGQTPCFAVLQRHSDQATTETQETTTGCVCSAIAPSSGLATLDPSLETQIAA